MDLQDKCRGAADALEPIIKECFYPITVHSGFDIIPPMVCGSSVLSVALLRIFGKVAELPLVATKKEYQKKGFFRCLLSSIEGALTQLNVDTIVVPAAEDASSIWTDKLGFQRVTDEQMFTQKLVHFQDMR
ncbi:hypothetical protein QJS10_CPB20g00985 [Acorus calamus]|uniref:Increased DNA methylation 1 C-terminal domain-containing protein n=1 Tax=Acorus calamus TaxID=4465 RepID=A0AAV9CCI4_ACOCL|nr:hypothetical protein QJS10_CPB20g00985 [Acorus calamus]